MHRGHVGRPAELLAERLESLSTYTRLFRPDDARNPVVYAHLRVNQRHVLSRICEAGKEHTGRTNHLAHHLVLSDDELPPAGPAWLLSRHDLMLETWTGALRWLDPSRSLPSEDSPPRACRHWKAAVGDAAWARRWPRPFWRIPSGPSRSCTTRVKSCCPSSRSRSPCCRRCAGGTSPSPRISPVCCPGSPARGVASCATRTRPRSCAAVRTSSCSTWRTWDQCPAARSPRSHARDELP